MSNARGSSERYSACKPRFGTRRIESIIQSFSTRQSKSTLLRMSRRKVRKICVETRHGRDDYFRYCALCFVDFGGLVHSFHWGRSSGNSRNLHSRRTRNWMAREGQTLLNPSRVVLAPVCSGGVCYDSGPPRWADTRNIRCLQASTRILSPTTRNGRNGTRSRPDRPGRQESARGVSARVPRKSLKERHEPPTRPPTPQP